jgi:inner membrane protein
MMAGSHVILGVCAWFYVARRMGMPPLDPTALGIAAAGSLLPDIDHPKSWIGRRLRVVSVPIAAVFGHRGMTHSMFAVVACIWVLRWDHEHWRVALPLVVGYASHLAADLFTPAGLCLTWPVRRTFALPLVKTGGFGEQVVVTFVAGWLYARSFCGW